MRQEEFRLCAEDHPGHGPQYLWNASIGGKTRARNLSLWPELEKVETEVQTYEAFVRLIQELIAINDRIRQMRPVRSIKKTAEAFRREAEEALAFIRNELRLD
jgi:hypothetical protein